MKLSGGNTGHFADTAKRKTVDTAASGGGIGDAPARVRNRARLYSARIWL